MDAAVGEVKGKGDGRSRTARKGSVKGAQQTGLASTGVGNVTGEASAAPFSGRGDVDAQKEALLGAASQVWRNSPGGGVFQRTFDADELEEHAGESPVR